MLRKSRGVLAAASVALATTAMPALADTIERALVQAYVDKPQVNAQRAALRATDENVPQALSGYRPRISATGSVGELYTDQTSLSRSTSGVTTQSRQTGWTAPKSVGATLTQTLYNGFQTANRTRQAEGQVFAARETLRVIEQTVLLDAAISYMNLLRDNAILDLQRRNVEVIQEQLRQTRDRFNVGEVTRTDVAQAESRVAAAQSQMLAAQANQTTSRAAYRRVIGVEAGRLNPGTPVDRLSPRVLDLAIAQGQA